MTSNFLIININKFKYKKKINLINIYYILILKY